MTSQVRLLNPALTVIVVFVNNPMNATQTKDRLYAQLAASLRNMLRAVGHTADLFEQLQYDLDAMRVLAGTHTAQCALFISVML